MESNYESKTKFISHVYITTFVVKIEFKSTPIKLNNNNNSNRHLEFLIRK